ncbi:MAG: hypothetical protein IPF57_11760 [Gammaproteobacteria bacterium]|nr:hypothetical protein [Gammaproteobacteria bacterium]MBK9467995.1 hypothetical protein [Gammaproteobacteria bacterium]MBP7910241.1 hypothetical protein [Pseudomonadales bacterium]
MHDDDPPLTQAQLIAAIRGALGILDTLVEYQAPPDRIDEAVAVLTEMLSEYIRRGRAH